MRKKYFFVKVPIFCINLAHWAKKRPFVEKFSSDLSQLHPTCLLESLEEEFVFVNFLVFPFVFGHWAILFRPFLEFFLVGFVTNASYMSLELTGGRMNFFETFEFSYSFLTMCGDVSTFYWKAFVGFVKTAPYVSLQIFGGRINSCKTFFSYLFPTLSQNFWPFFEKFWKGSTKLHPACPQEQSEETYFFCKNSNFLYHFRTRSIKTSAFCQKISVGVVTTASHMSSGFFGGRITFCRTFSFCYPFRTLSEHFSTFSREVFVGFVTTAYYMSFGTFGGRIAICKTFDFFLFFFWHWAENFQTFVEKFSTCLSKLHLTCLQE